MDDQTIKADRSKPVPGEDELLQKHQGLVHAILRRDFAGLKIEYDDALQIGMLALLEAIRTFDSEKGTSLPAWATTFIRRRLIKEYRRMQAEKRKADRGAVSLDAPISEEDDRTLQIPDPGQDPEREAVARVQVERLKRHLRGRDLEIVEMLSSGRSIAEVCEATGLSRFAVGERMKQMRNIVEVEKPVGTNKNNQINGSLTEMNDIMFAQMRRLSADDLSGETLQQEVVRSKALADVATRIIQSGELVLRAHTFRDRQVDADEKLPRLLCGDDE